MMDMAMDQYLRQRYKLTTVKTKENVEGGLFVYEDKNGDLPNISAIIRFKQGQYSSNVYPTITIFTKAKEQKELPPEIVQTMKAITVRKITFLMSILCSKK